MSITNRDTLVPGLPGRRKAAGYTQQGLAAALGVKRLAVLRWETGEQAPHLKMVRKMAALLGCSQADLIEPEGTGTAA